MQLVVGDLFVTNTGRLKKRIEPGCCNSILISLNQTGSVSGTMNAVRMTQRRMPSCKQDKNIE